MRHYTHNPRGISILQRIGIGIFLSIVAAVASGIIERQRRKVRISEGEKKKKKKKKTKLYTL
jgi:peptide/histidine transporter 3/4